MTTEELLKEIEDRWETRLRLAASKIHFDQDRARTDISRLIEMVREREKVIQKLPKTADGVPIYNGMKAWYLIGNDIEEAMVQPYVIQGDAYYSTREAALRASSPAKGEPT